MLDKVAGILKKKRKNQRDTTVKGDPRFPLFFKLLPFFHCLLLRYFLLIVCFLPLYRFPRLCRAVFHFLIEKSSFQKIPNGHLNDLSYPRYEESRGESSE